MARKKLTQDEIMELQKSTYVLDATPNIIHFSAEFKEKFWNGMMSGIPAKEIVISLGINHEILGKTRIDGLKSMIKKEVIKGDGFRDWNTYIQSGHGHMSTGNRIKYLEMQLAYKEQEIEFLKKIVSLDQERRGS